MKKFEIGQKVVALNDAPADHEHAHYVQYRKGKIYVIKEIAFCPFCGDQMLDIGIDIAPFPNGSMWGPTVCDSCDKTFHNSVKGEFCTHKDFAPITEIDDLIASALEIEDYETAAVLRDVKPKTL